MNTYSITGKRFYDNWHSRNHAREYSDRVCLAFGIQPIENGGRTKSTSYAEWYNRGRGTSWKEQIRQELDRLVPEVKNLEELAGRSLDGTLELYRNSLILSSDTLFLY